jgi:phenylacetate-coenzyme A ligase PaaK-like adenylate-forming protein
MEITPLEDWIAGRLGSERLSRAQIEAYQLQRLGETIGWVRRRSSFYRERLAGLNEGDLRDLQDLGRFPFTTADDLRQNHMRFLCVSQSEVERVVTLQTSGTSGAPKRLYFTAADQEGSIDFFHHGMATLAGPGDRVLILVPGGRPGSQGDLLAAGLRQLGAAGISHGPVRDAGETLEVMIREKIDVLVGLPVQILSLARHSGGKAAPRAVVLCSDHAPEAIRRELHRLWGCEVFTHYGMTEMGLGGGVECRAHSGYHLRELDIYFEIIDPQTGGPVRDGDLGEAVFTTLSRRAMPLIRYRTGDLSRFLMEPCPCGTVLKSLEKVRNRLKGKIDLGGEVLTMADLDEALFSLDGLLDFDARLSRAGGFDLLRIEVYAIENRQAGNGEVVRRALQTIPAIGAADAENGLKLSVEIQATGHGPARGAAKRTIVDERHSGRHDERWVVG